MIERHGNAATDGKLGGHFDDCSPCMWIPYSSAVGMHDCERAGH
jgi:hypothetical protein